MTPHYNVYPTTLLFSLSNQQISIFCRTTVKTANKLFLYRKPFVLITYNWVLKAPMNATPLKADAKKNCLQRSLNESVTTCNMIRQRYDKIGKKDSDKN